MDSATREKIVAILAGAYDMTLATIRPDGYPQATTVGYVNDGVKIYFGTAADLQKARNIALCDKVSLTVTLPYDRWEEIQALSMGARAARVTDAGRDGQGRPPHAEKVPARRGFRPGGGRQHRDLFHLAGCRLGAGLPPRLRPHRAGDGLSWSVRRLGRSVAVGPEGKDRMMKSCRSVVRRGF